VDRLLATKSEGVVLSQPKCNCTCN